MKVLNNLPMYLNMNCGTAGMACSCNSLSINSTHVDMLLQVILVSLKIVNSEI